MFNPKVFEIIKCPECFGREFCFTNLPDKGDVKESGALICKGCRQLYVVQEGILSLVKSELADKERELTFISNCGAMLPAISVTKRIEDLQRKNRSQFDLERIISEKAFWDQKKCRKSPSAPIQYSWNRYDVRDRHITAYINKEVRGKIVVEFGSGNSGTLYHIMNPQKLGYTLVCTDISYNALLIAKHLHPDAIIIQCDATNPPFMDNMVDVIFEFGVLHHLPENDAVLKTHIKLLKKGGYLGLHEPMDRRPGFLPAVIKSERRKGNRSMHHESISEKKTLDYLGRYGKIINQHVEYSPVRNLLVGIFVDMLRINARWFHYLTVRIDQFVIRTIGKIWRRMDASALLLVWQKNGKDEYS